MSDGLPWGYVWSCGWRPHPRGGAAARLQADLCAHAPERCQRRAGGRVCHRLPILDRVGRHEWREHPDEPGTFTCLGCDLEVVTPLIVDGHHAHPDPEFCGVALRVSPNAEGELRSPTLPQVGPLRTWRHLSARERQAWCEGALLEVAFTCPSPSHPGRLTPVFAPRKRADGEER